MRLPCPVPPTFCLQNRSNHTSAPLTPLSFSTAHNYNLPLNVPFAPFSCSDKVGRIADWTRNFNNQTRSKTTTDSAFNFTLDDPFPGNTVDDATFRLVDGKPPPHPKFGPKWRYQQQKQLPQCRDEEVEAKKRDFLPNTSCSVDFLFSF